MLFFDLVFNYEKEESIDYLPKLFGVSVNIFSSNLQSTDQEIFCKWFFAIIWLIFKFHSNFISFFVLFLPFIPKKKNHTYISTPKKAFVDPNKIKQYIQSNPEKQTLKQLQFR